MTTRVRRSWLLATAVAAALLLLPARADAHVKWFSDFDFRDPPLPFSEVVDTRFVVLTIAAAIVMAGLPALDRWLEANPLYVSINEWLAERRHHGDAVIRFSMAAVLLITWSSRALLTPELAEPADWIGWIEFVLAVLLLTGRFDRIGGAGLIGLWIVGVVSYGAFHMLDYLHVIGIGAFLILRASDRRDIRGLGVPVLSLTVGFSLMWLGFEKLVYPEWSFAILESRPLLRFGLPAELFLDGAAFVEIGLGFLLMIGLLGRPLALVITIVFISTTLVFGRVEVIGHTPVHAALVVFLLHGPGSMYPAPIAIHRDLRARMAFAGVNFVVLAIVFGVLYTASARVQFDNAVAERGPLPPPIAAATPAPAITSVTVAPSPTGHDVTIELDSWTFAPPVPTDRTDPVDDDAAADIGYGVLVVDGTTIARFDRATAALWVDIGDEDATLRLFTVDGRAVEVDGEPLRLTVELRTP